MHDALQRSHSSAEDDKQELSNATKDVFERRFQDIATIANDSAAGEALRDRLKQLHVGWLEETMGGRYDFQDVVRDTYNSVVYKYEFVQFASESLQQAYSSGKTAMIHVGNHREPVLAGTVMRNKRTKEKILVVSAYKRAWLLGSPNQQQNELDRKIADVIFGNAPPFFEG